MTQLDKIRTSLKKHDYNNLHEGFIAENVGCKLYVYFAILLLLPKFRSP